MPLLHPPRRATSQHRPPSRRLQWPALTSTPSPTRKGRGYSARSTLKTGRSGRRGLLPLPAAR
eukprot:3797492-Lingulodinium_polyedra.AAC.1